jgi:hypothetical protein
MKLRSLARIGLPRWLAGLFGLALLAHGALAAQARVKVDSGLTGVRVDASQVVYADANTLWNTLTDYNRLAAFIPDMVSSRVISAPGSPKRVEQIADAGLFAFIMPDRVVLAIEELPGNSLRFRAVSGKVASMSGEWRIIGNQSPVTLYYHSHVLPLTPLPPLVSDYFIESEVRARFEAVGTEAERRMR